MKRLPVSVMVLAMAAAWAASMVAVRAGEPSHTVAVQGEARIAVVPDSASIELGVVNQDASAAKALAGNNAKMSKVIAAIRAQGIPEKDIVTTAFRIVPRYDKRSEEGDYDSLRLVVGYEISNSVTVTVFDLSKISKIIDAAVTAGANAADAVTFRLENALPFEDRVNAEAVKAARHKAEVLASAAGAILGKAVSISDNRAETEYGRRNGAYIVAVRNKAAGTPVQSGQITVSAAVSVVYELK